MRINHEIHFAWQGQYLLKLEGDSCCSAHCKWRFICDADQSRGSFFRGRRSICWRRWPGGGLGLFVAGAAFREILGDSWSAKCFLFHTKCVSKMRRVGSPKAAGARWRSYLRTMLGSWSNQISFGGSNWGFEGLSTAILTRKIAWQAQYLVKLGADSCCSAHCKWHFIYDADRGLVVVAGAVFGEAGGWLLLLRAFEMTLHTWCGSIMRFILRGRHKIGEVTGWLLLLGLLKISFHTWCGAIMRVTFRAKRSIWWSWRMILLLLCAL